MQDGPALPVGMSTRLFADPARTDWDGGAPRPLRTTVWYPAAPNAPTREVAFGPPRAPFFVLADIAVDAAAAAPAEGCPVVLLSHGTGGTAAGLGWLATGLAAAGHVVVAVDHHGNTAVEPYRAEGFLAWWERPRDLSVALDALAADPAFSGRLDPGRVFAAGFSLGGHTALALAGAREDGAAFDAFARSAGLTGVREFPGVIDRQESLVADSAVFRTSLARRGDDHADPRVRAVFAMAPAPPVRGFTEDGLRRLRLPVAILVGGGDEIAPPDPCSRWLAARLPDCSLTVEAPEVGHYVFLPEGLPGGRRFDPGLFEDPPGVDRRALHEKALAMALAVFRRGTRPTS